MRHVQPLSVPLRAAFDLQGTVAAIRPVHDAIRRAAEPIVRLVLLEADLPDPNIRQMV